MSKMKIIETERLILRPFTEEDIEPSFKMNQDPEVIKYTGDEPTPTMEAMRERLEKSVFTDYKTHGYGRHAVIEKTTMDFIGFTGLKYLPDLDEVDLGYRFIRSKWGIGYATETGRASLDFGFKHLGLKRIIGLVVPEHGDSSHVLEKLGFEYEKNIIDFGMEVRLFALHSK